MNTEARENSAARASSLIIIAMSCFLSLFAFQAMAQEAAFSTTGHTPPNNCGGSWVLRGEAQCTRDFQYRTEVIVRDSQGTLLTPNAIVYDAYTAGRPIVPGARYPVSLSVPVPSQGTYSVEVRCFIWPAGAPSIYTASLPVLVGPPTPLPIITFTPSTGNLAGQSICAPAGGQRLQLGDNLVPPPGYTSTWTFNNAPQSRVTQAPTILTPNAANSDVTINSDGLHSFTKTLTGGDPACPFLSSAIVTIQINERPTLTQVQDLSLCAGNTSNRIPFVASIAGANISWINTETAIGLPSSGVGAIAPFTATNNTLSEIPARPQQPPQPGQPRQGNITVTASNNGCNSDPMSFWLTVLPDLTLNVQSNQTTYCSSETINLTGGPATAPAGFTFSWTGPNGFTASTLNAQVLNSTPAHSGTYTLTANSSGGSCVRTGSVTVAVQSGPTFVLKNNGNLSVCSPGALDLTATDVTAGSSPNLTFAYFSTDPHATTTLPSQMANPNRVTATGTYYIRATGAGFCPAARAVNVTISAQPQLLVTSSGRLCTSELGTGGYDLETAINKTTSTSGLTYTYFKDQAATIALTSKNVSQQGTYYIKGENPTSSCSVVQAVTVNILSGPTMNLTVPSKNCGTATVQLDEPSITVNVTPAGVLFEYYDTDANGAATTQITGTALAVSNGKYIIRGIRVYPAVNTAPEKRCSVDEPINIDTKGTPALSVTYSNFRICETQTGDISSNVTVTNTAVSPGPYDYEFYTSNVNNVLSARFTTPTMAPSLSRKYYVKVTDRTTQCDALTSFETNAVSPPRVTLKAAAVCNGNTINLNVSNPSVITGAMSIDNIVFSENKTNGAELSQIARPATGTGSDQYEDYSVNVKITGYREYQEATRVSQTLKCPAVAASSTLTATMKIYGKPEGVVASRLNTLCNGKTEILLWAKKAGQVGTGFIWKATEQKDSVNNPGGNLLTGYTDAISRTGNSTEANVYPASGPLPLSPDQSLPSAPSVITVRQTISHRTTTAIGVTASTAKVKYVFTPVKGSCVGDPLPEVEITVLSTVAPDFTQQGGNTKIICDGEPVNIILEPTDKSVDVQFEYTSSINRSWLNTISNSPLPASPTRAPGSPGEAKYRYFGQNNPNRPATNYVSPSIQDQLVLKTQAQNKAAGNPDAYVPARLDFRITPTIEVEAYYSGTGGKPTQTTCAGKSEIFTVIVNPKPSIQNLSPSYIFCSPKNTDIELNANVAASSNLVVSYAWDVTAGAATVGATAQTTKVNATKNVGFNFPTSYTIAQTLTNNTGVDVNFSYGVTPYSTYTYTNQGQTFNKECAGSKENLNVTVKDAPPPVIDPTLPLSYFVCEDVEDGLKIDLRSNATQPEYSWNYKKTPVANYQINGKTVIKGLSEQNAFGSATQIKATLSFDEDGGQRFIDQDTTVRDFTYTLLVSEKLTTCVSNPVDVTVTYRPKPRIKTITVDKTLACSQEENKITLENNYATDDSTRIRYVWMRDQINNTDIVGEEGADGIAKSPVSSPIAVKLLNNGVTPVKVSYNFKPYDNNTGCWGDYTNDTNITAQEFLLPAPRTTEIEVIPFPGLQFNSKVPVICGGGTTNIELTDSRGVTGTKFTWNAITSARITPTIEVDTRDADGNPVKTNVASNLVPSFGPIVQKITLNPDANNVIEKAIVTYTITPVYQGCVGNEQLAVVEVYPTPVLAGLEAKLPNVTATRQEFCSEEEFQILPIGALTETKYLWDVSYNRDITGTSIPLNSAPKSSNEILQRLENKSRTNAQRITYTVTPVTGSADDPSACRGDSKDLYITINPIPDTGVISEDMYICSGGTSILKLSQNNATDGPAVYNGITYTWGVPTSTPALIPGTNNTTDGITGGVGLTTPIPAAADGTAQYTTPALTNVDDTQSQTLTYAIESELKLTGATTGCKGKQVYATVVVNPQPKVIPSVKHPIFEYVICSSSKTSIELNSSTRGALFTWTTAKVSPVAGNVDQTTPTLNLDQQLTNPESDLDPMLPEPPTVDKQDVIYQVKAVYTHPQDKKQKGCFGPEQEIKVVVLPKPKVIVPGLNGKDKDFCSGTPTEPIQFTSTVAPQGAGGGTINYRWTSDNIGIGLPTQGDGDTPEFTPFVTRNPGGLASNVVVASEYVLIDRFNLNNRYVCSGPVESFIIKINPEPTISADVRGNTNKICDGNRPFIDLSDVGTLPDVKFSWDAISSDVRGGESKVDQNVFAANNPLYANGSTPGTLRYEFRGVTDKGCQSSTRELVNITVSPTPNIEITPDSQSICTGEEAVINIQATNSVAGTYSWTAIRDNVPGADEQNNITETTIKEKLDLDNKTFSGYVKYTITPSAGACIGMPKEATVDIFERKSLAVTNPSSQVYCVGEDVNLTVTATPSVGVNYVWYQSIDASNGSWVPVGSAVPFVSRNEILSIVNPREDLTGRFFKVRVSDENCTSNFVESDPFSAQLTDIFSGTKIEADVVKTLVEKPISYKYVGPDSEIQFEWDFGDGGKSNEKNPVHFYFTKGEFDTRLTVKNSFCAREVKSIHVRVTAPDEYGSVITGLNSDEKVSVHAYPVPMRNVLNITSTAPMESYRLEDAQGKVLTQNKLADLTETQIVTSELVGGLYILRLRHTKGETVIKLVK